jgi:structural maintenance of chromosome 3 (chondroitin sulfate proteoglycan 6)
MMDHNTSRGLAAVRRIKRQYNLDGVYGTLAELITVPDKYRTAVEVTAGNSLFHVVVDNDETATKILEILNKEKAGRVTFMPLNRLKGKNADIPKANDTLPLIEKIKYEKKFERAFQQVFGKTVICRDLQIAAQFARSHGLNAITPEGDRSDKKGALSGGYHDPRSSRLEAVRNVTKWREELDSKKARNTTIKKDLDHLDQQITKAVGELQKLEQRRQQVQNSNGPLRQELKSKQDLLRNKQDSLEAKQRAKQSIETNVKSLTDQQNAHQAELATEFKKDLTAAEETELENLGTIVQDLRKQYSELSSTRSDLEARKSILEVELRENLHPRLDQLQALDIDSPETGTGVPGTLKDRTRELKRLDKTLQDLSARLQETEDSLEASTTEILALETRNAETQKDQEDIAKAIEKHQRRMEKGMQRKAELNRVAIKTAQSIQDLGILPQDANTRFKNMESSAVLKRLTKVSEQLKKLGPVNKKAFEQYNNFTQQREVLTERREELDLSQKSIDELITVLDQRKDEAIERTFKQVSKEFHAVFEKLVPAGHGRLIIQKRTDPAPQEAADDDSDEEEERRKESVENYTGVGIAVSFNSKHDDQQRIQQLSGGQKSKPFPPIPPFPSPNCPYTNNLQQVYAPSPSYSPSKPATPPPSTSSTRSTPTSTRSTAPPSP